MKHFYNPQGFTVNVRIQYVYYEVVNSHELPESAVHQIHCDKIMDCLEKKNYLLKKEDILYLLKEDGAHFFEDSLRIYDANEKNFFQLSDEWEFDAERFPDVILRFWLKPTTPNFKRKFDDLSNEIKKIQNLLKGQYEVSQESLKSEVNDLKSKVEVLRTSNQVLFQQLLKLHQQSPPPPGEDIPPLSSRQASAFDHGLGDNASAINPFPDYSNVFSGNKVRASNIDIALMYSDPLVKKDDIGMVSLGDSVDYEEECNRLIEIFKAEQKQLTVYFEIATLTHLVNIISMSPIILHIICHGDYDKQSKKFYLCFEEEGRLKELYSDDLKKKLEAVDVKTKVVFVNACHSEEVAKVFSEAGVPCVIAVQSELKIEDKIAQKFSETLYWQLLSGKPIGKAFNDSRVAVSEENVFTCCCAHSHKPDCEWEKYARENGYEKAHHVHTPACTSCKFANKFHHKLDCEWAFDFLLNVCNKFDTEGDYLHACCCSPELPHNEAMKFKLICPDESVLEQPLFENKEGGKVVIKSNHSCVEQKFPVQKITGRNKELYETFQVLTDREKKFVNLYGIEGVGKSSLAKHLANYLFERGFFRDKISIIMLEKTPSITHFRSDLFKEVPGANDWKNFCESIKLSKILFILEKCDELIEKNKDQFIQDLATIVRTAIHVKFILITNKKHTLGLGESYVWMRELKKLDAAKLLYKNAYSFLSCQEKNIYHLCEHPVFDYIPLTPQGIWSVSEKLKNKSLDDIARDLQTEKIKMDIDGLDAKELSVKTTLEEIKTWGLIYNLVIFICLFPSGLSYEDMEELSLQGRIPSNWKSVLISYLQGKKQPEKLQANELNSAGNRDSLTRNDFKPDNYIWMNILKDPQTNEIHFVPTQFISRYIENNLKADSYEKGIKKLEYMTLLSLAIIRKSKSNFDYNEKLLELSMISNYGIWEPCSGEIFDIYAETNQMVYFDSSAFDLSNIKKCFGYHEPNLLSCLEPTLIESALAIDGTKRDHILEILEILCLSIPTLFKVMYPGDSPAGELVRRAERILDSVPQNPRLYIIRAKLYLFQAALSMGHKTDVLGSFGVAKIQLELAEEVAHLIPDINKREAVLAEIYFARAVYLYRGLKKNCLKSEDITNRSSIHKDVKNLLKNAESLVNKLPDNSAYNPFKAKITLLTCKARDKYNKKGLDSKLIDDISRAQNFLKHYDSQRLLMKIHYMYACVKLELEKKRVNAKQNSSVENTRIVTQELVKTKNLHLIKPALEIAKKIKDKPYESKIKRMIDEINMEIRHGYFNVITLMRAAPIVEIKQNPNVGDSTDRKFENEITAIGFPARLPQTFKQDLIQTLEKKNRVLCTKFEILTKEKLKDCLQNGCRILHINCFYVEPNTLCVEAEYGRLERISFDELREIFGPKPSPLGNSGIMQNMQAENKFLDVLLLGVKNNRQVADFFVEMKIPHIITFEFTSNEYDFRHKTMEDECMTKFSIIFYEQLVLHKSVLEAFEAAYDKTFEYLSQTYFDGKPNNYAIRIIGEGPILLPKNGDHTEVLFNEAEFPLPLGRIEDISSTRGPNNIEKLPFPYTGRNKDIYNVMKKVCEKHGFFKITGAPGTGKTTFVLQVAYYILTRDHFPDGIFYIPVKKLKHKPHPAYEMKDLIKETLGLDVQSGIKNFFKGKNMLLIFDDFDLFYNKDMESPQLIFPLKGCNDVSCILITTSKPKTEKDKYAKKNQKKIEIEGELLDKHAKWELKPMTEDELAHMALSLSKMDKKNLSSLNLQNVKESLALKNLQGSPKNLIECLIEKKIEVLKKPLEINPAFEKAINYEQRFLANKSHHNPSSSYTPSFNSLARQNSLAYSTDQSKMSRLHSSNELRLTHSPLHTIKRENKHNSMPPDLYKSKLSQFQDKSSSQLSHKGTLESERSNKGKGAKQLKKPNTTELDENSFLSKSELDSFLGEDCKRFLGKPGTGVHEQEEEEKGMHGLSSEEQYDFRHIKESDLIDFQEPLEQIDFKSSEIGDEDLEDVSDEEPSEVDNVNNGSAKISMEDSFTESELTNKSQRKGKNENQNNKSQNNNSQNNRTNKASKSGKQKKRYQKKTKNVYYKFKENENNQKKKNSSQDTDD